MTLADDVRPSSRAVVDELKQLGIRQLVMLTGDNEETAQLVAQQVGVTEVRANRDVPVAPSEGSNECRVPESLEP